MQKKTIQTLHRVMVRRLTDKSFLKRSGLSKRFLLGMLGSDAWKEKIAKVIKEERYTCKGIQDIFKEDLEKICPTPPEGWLGYAYRYIIHILFPEKPIVLDVEQYESGALFYLELLQIFLINEGKTASFDPMLDFKFMPPQESEQFPFGEEFARFLQIYRSSYIYELMRIGKEIQYFNTLGHIAGVHYIAMHVGRQLYDAGVSIDLALLSGAAAGHDVGKYGCRPEEENRIPYLHYYYSDQWYKRSGIPGLGHIAANHSTWDLELENLSVESLVLIYADFRVKAMDSSEPVEQMHIYSLDDSYEVILNKLDNVDDAKKLRYSYVYTKLHDFEDYMFSLGVNCDLSCNTRSKVVVPDVSLMDTQQSIKALRHLAIHHNIYLMHEISGELTFANILESARSEKDWKNIRDYINIFEEYFTYMTQKQKSMTLHFLYELLMHREGDIRRQAAHLMGLMVVHYDEEYRKELPKNVTRPKDEVTGFQLWEKYLTEIISPDHKITEQHRSWLGYTLKIVVETVLTSCKQKDSGTYIASFLKHLDAPYLDDATAFMLLDTIAYLPLSVFTQADLEKISDFAFAMSVREPLEIHAAILLFIKALCEQAGEQSSCLPRVHAIFQDLLRQEDISMVFLKYKIAKSLQMDKEVLERYEKILYGNSQYISEIFLENLKVATPWMMKSVNIEFLLDQLRHGQEHQVLHVATHLSNLLKVSERVVVRHAAGKTLTEIAPMLSKDQRNEVAIELTKGLEIGEYEFSKYVPDYLGKFALYLYPRELDELIANLEKLLKSANDRVGCVTLSTLGVMIRHYPVYKTRFGEDDKICTERWKKLVGLLLSGLSNYHDSISKEAFLVIGKYLFGSKEISHHYKLAIFRQIHKKLLVLTFEKKSDMLSLFYNGAALNHIYRFIVDHVVHHTSFHFHENKKIAFFPGTFDPFSLSHKGIVTEIRNLGFEVYLALDEFSWSKKTQPRLIRRQIINMSVADEFDVYLFPDDIPVNIANAEDLGYLKRLFQNREVYIVVGSDVVANASSYKKTPEINSIHSFNHIVFRRNIPTMIGGMHPDEQQPMKNMIKGELVELTLPVYLEDISSTRIRENIDYNRDIANLIDPVVQKYIYDNSLYLREPQYKPVLQAKSVDFQRFNHLSVELIAHITSTIAGDDLEKKEKIEHYLKTKDVTAIVMRDGENGDRPVGLSLFHKISSAQLYDEFQDADIAQYVRKRTSGTILVLSGIYALKTTYIRDIEQLMLTETLAHCLKNDYTYALYHQMSGQPSERVQDILQRQGFEPITQSVQEPIYAVDMKFPITLIQDTDTILKEPLNRNKRVLDMIMQAHNRLQTALTKLYPGNLVLSFSADVMNHRLVKKITDINEVPSEQTTPRVLGENMCVPFSKIMRGIVVPNTVTKTLHTEKVFGDVRMKKFTITSYPFYSSLSTQLKTIKSFDKPVLLVDDLLHKGYRLKELDPLFKEAGVEINKVVVGIMSGRGKDLMLLQNREADSVYFIPNLRLWFVESNLYPFLGGDAVARSREESSGLLSSVNLILPYVSPAFVMGTSKKAIYDLSMVCMENAKDIMKVLEEEYQAMFERNLTLNRLSEVLYAPRCPYAGECIQYDINLAPSVYIENDIEKLIRLENFVL